MQKRRRPRSPFGLQKRLLIFVMKDFKVMERSADLIYATPSCGSLRGPDRTQRCTVVVHLLDQVSTLETVNLVLYTHIEWSCNGTLLLIAVNGHVVVVTLIGQLVDQSRISVECEDDRFIFCTISEQVRDFA